MAPPVQDQEASSPGDETLPPALGGGLTAELREAHRAFKGRLQRQEVYAEDGQGELVTLHTVTEATYEVVRLRPSHEGRSGCFRVDHTESLSAAYDLDLTSGTPDPRVSHTMSWGFDSYGTPTHTASVSYPRRRRTRPEQLALAVVVAEQAVIHQDEPSAQRWQICVSARAGESGKGDRTARRPGNV